MIVHAKALFFSSFFSRFPSRLGGARTFYVADLELDFFFHYGVNRQGSHTEIKTVGDFSEMMRVRWLPLLASFCSNSYTGRVERLRSRSKYMVYGLKRSN